MTISLCLLVALILVVALCVVHKGPAVLRILISTLATLLIVIVWLRALDVKWLNRESEVVLSQIDLKAFTREKRGIAIVFFLTASNRGPRTNVLINRILLHSKQGIVEGLLEADDLVTANVGKQSLHFRREESLFHQLAKPLDPGVSLSGSIPTVWYTFNTIKELANAAEGQKFVIEYTDGFGKKGSLEMSGLHFDFSKEERNNLGILGVPGMPIYSRQASEGMEVGQKR